MLGYFFCGRGQIGGKYVGKLDEKNKRITHQRTKSNHDAQNSLE